MKRHWMLAFLFAGALVISTVAQDVNAQSTNTVVTQQQGSSDNANTQLWSMCGQNLGRKNRNPSKCHQHLWQPVSTPRSRWS